MSLQLNKAADPVVPRHWIGIRRNWSRRPYNFVSDLVELTPDEMRKHVYVLGATGSGKSNLLSHLMAGDILRGHSMIVLCARGDGARAPIDLAARSGVDPRLVRYFDLSDNKEPLGFNPLSGSGEPFAKALGLIDATASEVETWGVQLAENFRYGALLLAETGSPITMLHALFNDRRERQAILSKATSKNLKEHWSKYDSLSAEKQGAIAAAVLNKVSILTSTEGLRRMFGHPHPVDIGKHLRTPGSITVINLSVHNLHQAGWRTGGLLLSTICREIFSQADMPEYQRLPIRLYVDEFENFDSRHFESILAEGRRFRFSLVLSHQTLAQVNSKFRSVVLNNAGVKILFRCSHTDADALNRDLTGARGTYDFPSLEVGHALLWRLGKPPRFIEINEPILSDSGCFSSYAKSFLAASREGHAWSPEIDADEQRQADCQQQTKKPGDKTSLEDWLK